MLTFEKTVEISNYLKQFGIDFVVSKGSLGFLIDEEDYSLEIGLSDEGIDEMLKLIYLIAKQVEKYSLKKDKEVREKWSLKF